MQLLVDFLPVVFFFVAYIVTKDIFTAIIVIMVVAPIVLAGQWFMTRKINRLTAISTGLVAAFGALTLYLDNPLFFYWKPTVFLWAVGLACLVSQFVGTKTIGQRMLELASQDQDDSFELTPPQWRTLNLMWVVYAFVAGTANIYVAYNFSEPTWVNFKLFGLMGLTVVFAAVQGFWLVSILPDDADVDADSDTDAGASD